MLGHKLEIIFVSYHRELDCVGRAYYHENKVYVAALPGNVCETKKILIHELTHIALKASCHLPQTIGRDDYEPVFSAETVCEMMSYLAPAIIACADGVMDEFANNLS